MRSFLLFCAVVVATACSHTASHSSVYEDSDVTAVDTHQQPDNDLPPLVFDYDTEDADNPDVLDADNGYEDNDIIADEDILDSDQSGLFDDDEHVADQDTEMPEPDDSVESEPDETSDSEMPDETTDEVVDETPDETVDEATDESSDNDIDTPPPVEICDGKDNNGDGSVDEGCDDDGDGYCDAAMYTYGLPPICPHGGLDCNDEDPDIYPFSTHFKEATDYDCDGYIEYMAEVVISVDDVLVDMCVNSETVSPLGSHYNSWIYADTYHFILESGDNVIGIHGRDAGHVISAFMATIKVHGQTIVTDGVMPKLPPPDPIDPYTPSDPQWTATPWRYYPTPADGGPNSDWCDPWYNDDAWGPAIRAGLYGQTDIAHWGELGASPWTMTCGDLDYRCPKDFRPYYDDSTTGNEPMWIWDYNPAELADAWFRIKVTLP